MKYCKYCKVDIKNDLDHCPLCHHTLGEGDGNEKETFPRIPVASKKYGFLLRLLMFLSVATIMITVTVNILVPSRIFWSLIVVVALLFFWVMIYSILHWKNTIVSISNSVLVLSVLVLLIDLFNGYYGWSVNYGIPALIFAGICSVALVSAIGGFGYADFIMYFIVMVIWTVVPLVLLLTGAAWVLWPCLSCIIGGILAMLAVVIFADKGIKDELKRRFHL